MKKYENNKKKRKGKILENLLTKQIIGLLLKNPMSKSDLAEKIYRDRNVRSGISKCIDIFLKEGWIKRVSKGLGTSKSEYYKAKLEVLGNFSKREYEFIQLCIGRFWDPVNYAPFESLTDMIIGMLAIKKIHKLKDKINGYNPQKDLDLYEVNKRQFREDRYFRDNFLNNIHKKRDKTNKIRNFDFYLRRDFIFVSMLTPETILEKLDLFKRGVGNPMFITLNVLDN